MITGKLIRAGTFVAEAEETTGVVIEVPRDVLRDEPTLPMYEQVAIVPIAELAALPDDMARIKWIFDATRNISS